jgi:bacteriorhodopsin
VSLAIGAAAAVSAVSAPWTATLTPSEYLLTTYFLVVATLALFAGFLRAWTTQHEVGSRYRPAIVARLAVTGVATAAYLLLLISFFFGYDKTAAGYVPNSGSVMLFAVRYMDWSVTVPLLAVELVAVCAVSGIVARRTTYLAGAAAFAMIFTGFLGATILAPAADGTENVGVLLLWGGISAVFWILTNVLLIGCVRRSLSTLTPESARLLSTATIVLLSGWVVYPLIYLLQVFGSGGGWTTAIQIALCTADVAVKIGFGTLIHRVAKLRTAEDVRAGDDVHPESIWISSVKQSDAGIPREVHLAAGAEIHERRPKPPMGSAVAADRDPTPDLYS